MIAAILSVFLLLQGSSEVPPGAVEGALRTVDGVPAVAVRVVAIRVPGGNPDDNLNTFELAAPVTSTLTDNDGNFSMMDVPPGRYYIMAGDSATGSYYPGIADIRKATIVTVTSNQIVESLNFGLLVRYGGRVTGNVKADMATLGPRTATLTGPPLQDLLEVPVRPDGTFDFGHVPPSDKLILSLYPPTSGISSLRVKVGDSDVTKEELVPLPTQTVTGRIVARKGPIPIGFLAFETDKGNYVAATINVDGTFSVQLHAARHHVEMDGLPIGYSVASVRVGSQDAAQGIEVGNKDISDVVVTLDVPQKLAVLRGRITGLSATRYPSTNVVMTGAIVGSLLATVRQDGTFEFPAVTPGLYTLKLNSVPEFSSMLVAIDGAETFDVTVAVPTR